MISPRFRTLCLLPAFGLMLAATGWLRQWPVRLSVLDAGAYRIDISEAVYHAAGRADLGDVDVLDARGQPVPAMLFTAAVPDARATAPQGLPWFPLPDAAALPNTELRVISERADDGRVLRLETREAASNEPSRSWLVDASALRAPLVALRLALTPDAQVEARLRVEGSDDLARWRVLRIDAGVLQLRRDGHVLRQTRIPLDGGARYLRLVLEKGDALPLAGVEAETIVTTAGPAREWRDYAASAASPDRKSFEFVVDGRQPFDRADVVLPGNSAARWRLESRDRADAPWRWRAGPWTQFQLGEAQRSPAQALPRLRQRQWRLVSDVAIAETPRLRLGWQPEAIVFVAAGEAPYRLVAGSARARRADAPLDELLAQMRARRGREWRPADAHIEGVGEAGDAAALNAPRDWKRIALWSVLVLAALLVVGFATSLLRAKPSRDDSGQGQ
ncbi:DUF3999 domain-containing protein [Lysobacter pythonis]|uniref:DUF3999 domain-containing protein n=1 Tax=Solilutibacter pythonis TaxID=2483112 RepID=A0A3M2HMS0_9GAMM|nr:DUF3999 domain-containing protein [Lysobacter pythonis]RMH91006.1 DUF3999 domain-containing protein [Lysobacter pythonis]